MRPHAASGCSRPDLDWRPVVGSAGLGLPRVPRSPELRAAAEVERGPRAAGWPPEEVEMASAKAKRDQSVREMLTRSHPGQNRQAETEALTRGAAPTGGGKAEGEAPVTKSFLTSLFDSLRIDLQELRKDISQEVRDLRSDLTSLGERVSNMEDSEISRGEEVEQLKQEVLRLREQQEQLQPMAVDLTLTLTSSFISVKQYHKSILVKFLHF
ncbi:hypothetical protein NDU88_006761 [Pleurodeles waltl]|uniref:Uncharacterized protein n=1 Tax=Pleurodeles waltl TaxID=8319 RepID=A0AAV7UMW0_PLEWA|nr:hypothetical protein NDU88_006761 [Pleurodeles waltl]